MDSRRARALGGGAAIALCVLLPALLLGWGGYVRRWIGDDGFINLRVVSQLLAGNGFVFNAGERSEVVTSPGWVLVLWLAGALGARLEDAAWLLGLGFSALGVALSGGAALLAQTRAPSPAQGRQTWFLPFGLLAYAALPPAWDYATSGLENGLGSSFLGLCMCLVAIASARPEAPRFAEPAAAFALSFAPLLRPDYELLALPLLALVCLRARGAWRRLGLAGLGVSAGLGYQVFRMGYFASWVPNSARAKDAFELRWEQGLRYLWNSVGLYWLLVPLCALALALAAEVATQRRGVARLHVLESWLGVPVCLLVGGLLHLGYIVRMGGDFMHARLLLPGFFAVFSALPALGLSRALPRAQCALRLSACAAIYGWAALCATRLRVPVDNESGIGDERGWYARMAMVENPTRIEHYADFYFHRDADKLRRALQRRCPAPADAAAAAPCPRVLVTRKPDGVLSDREPAAMLELAAEAAAPDVSSVVAMRPLGIAAAVLGLHVNLVDYFALADPIAARLVIAQRWRTGHDKSFDTAWQAARYATSESTADERVLSARHALSCGRLGQLSQATRGPLNLRRFLRNLKLAIVTSRLEVPHDHMEAELSFCPE